MKQCLRCKKPYRSHGSVCPFCGYAPETIAGFPVFSPELSTENEGFDKEVFEILYGVEPYHFWFTSRNKLLIALLAQYFPKARSFCEIGCGTGNVLTAISSANPGMSMAGSEIYLSALAYAAHRLPNASLFQADICQFPFVSEFDVIGCFDVLEHIETDVLALSNIYNALKDNGGLILTVPHNINGYGQPMMRWRAISEGIPEENWS